MLASAVAVEAQRNCHIVDNDELPNPEAIPGIGDPLDGLDGAASLKHIDGLVVEEPLLRDQGFPTLPCQEVPRNFRELGILFPHSASSGGMPLPVVVLRESQGSESMLTRGCHIRITEAAPLLDPTNSGDVLPTPIAASNGPPAEGGVRGQHQRVPRCSPRRL